MCWCQQASVARACPIACLGEQELVGIEPPLPHALLLESFTIQSGVFPALTGSRSRWQAIELAISVLGITILTLRELPPGIGDSWSSGHVLGEQYM